MSDVIDLTDEPDAKRQDVDLSKDINDLGLDLMQKVFENLPLREQARAAMASKDMKGAYDVARGNLLADADEYYYFVNPSHCSILKAPKAT